MTIQVYTTDKEQEKELLDFLDSRHYSYDSTDEKDEAFLIAYNKELDEAEQEVDNGDFLTHDEVKDFFSKK